MMRHEPDRYLMQTGNRPEPIPDLMPPAWKLNAPCNDEFDLFEAAAETGEPSERANFVKQAKQVCAGCSSIEMCKAEALAKERSGKSSRWGVYGGTSPEEREAIDQQRTRSCAGCGKDIPVRQLRCKPCKARRKNDRQRGARSA